MSSVEETNKIVQYVVSTGLVAMALGPFAIATVGSLLQRREIERENARNDEARIRQAANEQRIRDQVRMGQLGPHVRPNPGGGPIQVFSGPVRNPLRVTRQGPVQNPLRVPRQGPLPLPRGNGKLKKKM